MARSVTVSVGLLFHAVELRVQRREWSTRNAGTPHRVLEERDGVLRRELVGSRTLDIGRTAVPALIGAKHPEVLNQSGEVGSEHPGVGAAMVREHQRLSLPPSS
jgi:hypothetical protein